MNISNLLLGKSLKNDDVKESKLNVLWGLPILASDAISSVAYAGSAILLVLLPVAGLYSYKYMLYVSVMILFLMFLLIFSYKQVIDCYPEGGGAYIVAKDNLGPKASLTAAAALMVDYILTVAVSGTAGTEAITSAIPQLLPYKVLITVILIILLTIGNLRGIKEASTVFGVPTYAFVLGILSMIVFGLIKYHVFHYQPKALYPLPTFSKNIGILLFLKAFASGCTALTGIEAVSNAVPAFKKPSQRNAKIVLFLLALLVFLIFGGLSYLSTIYNAVPSDQQTVISQIATQVFGRNVMYYFIQATTAIILVMAANTAFSGLPLLLSIIAKDGYAPRQLTKVGKRLSYSNGILLIAVVSSLLVIGFNGNTDALLPLYAIGVFISFTIAQFGMLVRWMRKKPKGWVGKMFINGLGAIMTAFTAVDITATKFLEGAWVICLLIPFLVYLMIKIHKHYKIANDALAINCNCFKANPKEGKRYFILPVSSFNKSFVKAFNYAKSVADELIVVHISTNKAWTENLLKEWNSYNLGVELVIIDSPYREIRSPLIKFIEKTNKEIAPNNTLTVVLPQLVTSKNWDNLLHNQLSFIVRASLLKHRDIAVVTIPYII
ncbi:APC family permease [Clostridium massiliamazoniense]|uniref:APC family permease n=1 Tax=Clostridium massiliamazoniense TaxID=1347366 RepID=UPI0006D800F7|nr:APC family permease [Clostridium massiliamazoniense]